MEDLINRIKNASSREIDLIFDTALRRKRALYPDWAIYYGAAPKNNREERLQVIQSMLSFLEKEWEGE